MLTGAKIGKTCNINVSTFIETDMVIGNNVTVKSGVQIWDGLRIGDNVVIGPNVTFTYDFTPPSKQRPTKFLKTTLKHSALLGANSTIIGGLTIGKFAMIGADSVVTKGAHDYGLVYGNPAQPKGYVSECGKKLTNLRCGNCDIGYVMNNNALSREQRAESREQRAESREQ